MSILSTASTFFTGVPTEVYKWLAIIGVALILFTGDYYLGYHNGSSATAAGQMKQDLKQQEKTIVQVKTQTITDTTAVVALQSKLDGLTSLNQTLQARIQAMTHPTVEVATPVAPTQVAGTVVTPVAICELSADWSSVYNASLENTP